MQKCLAFIVCANHRQNSLCRRGLQGIFVSQRLEGIGLVCQSQHALQPSMNTTFVWQCGSNTLWPDFFAQTACTDFDTDVPVPCELGNGLIVCRRKQRTSEMLKKKHRHLLKEGKTLSSRRQTTSEDLNLVCSCQSIEDFQVFLSSIQ